MQIKISHLDLVGRPVVVIEKANVVPEHNQHFQVFLSPCNVKYDTSREVYGSVV